MRRPTLGKDKNLRHFPENQARDSVPLCSNKETDAKTT